MINSIQALRDIQRIIHQNKEFSKAFFESAKDVVLEIQKFNENIKISYEKYFYRLNRIMHHLSETGVAFKLVNTPEIIQDFLFSKKVITDISFNIVKSHNFIDLYLIYFPSFFNYFIKPNPDEEQSKQSHYSFMKEIYDKGHNQPAFKALFFNFAIVEFLTPQFIYFLKKIIDLSPIYFESTDNFVLDPEKDEFIKNFNKNIHKCPEYILDLIKITPEVITSSLQLLINKHPVLLDLVPYYIDAPENFVELKAPKNINNSIKNSIKCQKTVFLDVEIPKYFLETEERIKHEALRNILKELPPLPVVTNPNKQMTIESYLRSSINCLVHSNKRVYFEEKLNEYYNREPEMRGLFNSTVPKMIKNATYAIMEINPQEKKYGAILSSEYAIVLEKLSKYKEKYIEIQENLVGYYIHIYEKGIKSNYILQKDVENLKNEFPNIYFNYQIHMKFIKNNHKKVYKEFVSNMNNEMILHMKSIIIDRYQRLEDFKNDAKVPCEDFQLEMFTNYEKWIQKKINFCNAFSYIRDPLELYKIFDKFIKKMQKTFDPENKNKDQDHMVPFTLALISFYTPPNFFVILKYIQKSFEMTTKDSINEYQFKVKILSEINYYLNLEHFNAIEEAKRAKEKLKRN